MMIPVTDSGLRIALLLHLIEQIDRGEIPGDIGNYDVVDRVRKLNGSGLLRLAGFIKPGISVTFDQDAILAGVTKLNTHDEELENLVYFIRNGASLSMLYQYFTVDSDSIIAYRKMLLGQKKAGRSRQPTEAIRNDVHDAWWQIQRAGASDSAIQKLRKLHALFNGYSLEALYTTIKEFDDDINTI